MGVLLFASLKICADSWEKGENKMAGVNDAAVVYNFFYRHLSPAKPLWNDFSTEEKAFSFQGGTHALQFVSEFPASADRSGLQLFSVALQAENNEQFIKVTLTPFFPPAEGGAWRQEEVSLINHVSDFTLAYFGSADGVSAGSWQDEWLAKETLPRLVKITIQLDHDSYRPEMIIALKAAGTTPNTGLGAVNSKQVETVQ